MGALSVRPSYSSLPNITGKARVIDKTPLAILDCPDLIDDFYLNVLDWSSQNVVSVALDSSVYSYDFGLKCTYPVTSVKEGDYVSALRSYSLGSSLAVANTTGCISCFDTKLNRPVSSWSIPILSRIATLESNDNSCEAHLLLAGSQAGSIYGYDLRLPNGKPCTIFCSHDLEVCGLKISNGWQFASGGNDNKVCIWDLRKNTAIVEYSEYQSAIKALSWCSWQRNKLAVGSGTNDRKIYIYCTSTGSTLYINPVDSQVSGIFWAQHCPEIITTHGYTSNDIVAWDFPSMEIVARLCAHESRILHSTLSPDGTVLATCAANESLKFWNMYRPQDTHIDYNFLGSIDYR